MAGEPSARRRDPRASPGHLRHPAPAKKTWITGTSPVMTTMSGADAVIYTRILATGQP